MFKIILFMTKDSFAFNANIKFPFKINYSNGISELIQRKF